MKPTTYIIIGLAALLSSCSIQQKCHKLEKKIVRDSKFCQLILTDTVRIKDTVYIGTVQKDSTFILEKEIDTFYINKDRLHVQVVRHYDTLYVSGKCDSILVIKEIAVPVEYVHVKELNTFLRSFGKFFRRWFWVLIVIVVVAVLLRVFKKYIPFL